MSLKLNLLENHSDDQMEPTPYPRLRFPCLCLLRKARYPFEYGQASSPGRTSPTEHYFTHERINDSIRSIHFANRKHVPVEWDPLSSQSSLPFPGSWRGV